MKTEQNKTVHHVRRDNSIILIVGFSPLILVFGYMFFVDHKNPQQILQTFQDLFVIVHDPLVAISSIAALSGILVAFGRLIGHVRHKPRDEKNAADSAAKDLLIASKDEIIAAQAETILQGSLANESMRALLVKHGIFPDA